MICRIVRDSNALEGGLNRGKIMRFQFLSIPLLLVAFSVPAAPAQAQFDDITLRSNAMEACNVEAYGGYGSYEICVEAIYSDMINQGRYRVVYFITIPNGTEAREMPCFGSRLGDDCYV